jgi:hypothetical protein
MLARHVDSVRITASRDRDELRRCPLFPFGPGNEQWTIGDSFEGTQVFGATGSGKTTGSGAALATAFLKAGYGGLVLSAKPDELENWKTYFRNTGRNLNEITIIEPKFLEDRPKGMLYPVGFEDSADHVARASAFNFLQFEFEEGGKYTQNIVNLFLNAMSSGHGGPAVSRTDPYWDDALRELLTHAIDLCVLSGRSIDLANILEVIRSAPQSPQESKSPAWRERKPLCWVYMNEANERSHNKDLMSGGRYRDLAGTIKYWFVDFPSLTDRVRSVTVSSFTAKATALLRSPLRELFCQGDYTKQEAADPRRTHEGRIVILYLPVKLYGEVGRFAQVLYKTIWQRAAERRIGKLRTQPQRPIFLWADEAQYFIAPEDMQYQMTARSADAATVYLTQNISSYYATMGGENPEAAVDSLLGNLQTKIFHANGDSVTNEWAERLFGANLDKPTVTSSNNQYLYHDSLIPAVKFTQLKKGGGYEGEVESYIFQAGRQWNDDSTERHRHFFKQPQAD